MAVMSSVFITRNNILLHLWLRFFNSVTNTFQSISDIELLFSLSYIYMGRSNYHAILYIFKNYTNQRSVEISYLP